MVDERMMKIQSQAAIIGDQLSKAKRYLIENSTDVMWKDIILTELDVVLERIDLIDQKCRESIAEIKAS